MSSSWHRIQAENIQEENIGYNRNLTFVIRYPEPTMGTHLRLRYGSFSFLRRISFTADRDLLFRVNVLCNDFYDRAIISVVLLKPYPRFTPIFCCIDALLGKYDNCLKLIDRLGLPLFWDEQMDKLAPLVQLALDSLK